MKVIIVALAHTFHLGKGRSSFYNVVNNFYEIVASQLKRFKEETEGTPNMLRFY